MSKKNRNNNGDNRMDTNQTTDNVDTTNNANIGSVDTAVANTSPLLKVEPVIETAAPATIPVSAVTPTPPPVVVAPVAPVAPKPVAPKVEAPSVETEAVVTSVTGKIVLQNIDDYMEAMKPNKPVTVADGARHQVSLYRAITQTLNNVNEDFNIVFGTILRKFNAHKDGVFHETHVFRFFEHMALPENERRTFQRLLNLIKLTADPKGRSVSLNQVDMTKTLEHLPENSKQKILNFFNK